jgi:alpha-glucosidase
VFGGSAWELDPMTGQYYLHNFLPEQPDLNWWNEQVRGAFDDILRFWFDRGIAGFRIDVANGLIHDPELRDNPPATEDDPPEIRRRGQRQVYNLNRPEVHEIYRGWRTIADGYDPHRILVAETWVFEPEQLARFYGTGDDELHLCFNFSLVFSDFRAEALGGVVGSTEAALPPGAQPAWTGSNHDVGRFPTRWCDGQQERSRCALMALLMLRGTPFLYYGDEIGMTDVAVPEDDQLDLVGGGGTEQPSRDGCRTPMQWSADPSAGFTRDGVRPWLPIGDAASRSVAAQREDPGSMLNLCRDLIALRREMPDLRSGRYASIPSPADVWTWSRGDGTVVSLNLSEEAVTVPIGTATIAIGTGRERDGEQVGGELSLGPWEGAVLRVAPS